jgi:hypothetical protein
MHQLQPKILNFEFLFLIQELAAKDIEDLNGKAHYRLAVRYSCMELLGSQDFSLAVVFSDEVLGNL